MFNGRTRVIPSYTCSNPGDFAFLQTPRSSRQHKKQSQHSPTTMMMTNHHMTGDTTSTSSTNPVLYPVPAVATPPQPQSTSNSSQQQLTLSTASSCSSCPLCSLCRALGLSHPTQQQEEQELRDSGLAKWFTVCLAVLLLGSALILLIQYSRYSTTWYLCGNMFLASFALVVLRRLNSNANPTDKSKAQLYETLITVFAAVLSWKSLEDAFKGYNYGVRYAFGYPSRLFIVWQLMTVVTSWLYVRRLYRERRQQQQQQQACGDESTTAAPTPTAVAAVQPQQQPELRQVNSSTAPSSFNNFHNSSITEQQQAQWQPWPHQPQLPSWSTALPQQPQPPSSYKLFIPPYTIRPQQQQQQPQELGQQ